MEGMEIDKNFSVLFEHQMVILFQLYFHVKSQNQLLFDRDKKIQIYEASLAKQQVEGKEQQLKLKQT